MPEYVQSFAIGITGLTIVFLISLLLAFTRPLPTAVLLHSVKRIYLLAICFQAVHLTEESVFGFYEQFPRLLGLTPWPVWLFLSFNILWLVIWCTGLVAGKPKRIVIATMWFLALGSLLNGVAHPVLAIAVGSYFPGLFTSTLVGVLGILFVRALYRITNSNNIQ